MSFDPDALETLGGRGSAVRGPATAAFLVRVGSAAAVGAAVCDVLLYLLAAARGWDLDVGDQRVRVLGIVLVCLLVGVLAGLAGYVAVRVTKRPEIWVALIGTFLLVASVRGLPPALVGMHVVTGVWVIGWLTAAVRGGSHLR